MDLLVKVVKDHYIKIYYVPIEIAKSIIKELKYLENWLINGKNMINYRLNNGDYIYIYINST